MQAICPKRAHIVTYQRKVISTRPVEGNCLVQGWTVALPPHSTAYLHLWHGRPTTYRDTLTVRCLQVCGYVSLARAHIPHKVCTANGTTTVQQNDTRVMPYCRNPPICRLLLVSTCTAVQHVSQLTQGRASRSSASSVIAALKSCG